MGYAKGVRFGHAGGHLRDPLEAAMERGYGGDPWWSEFGSRQAARAHVGMLWHCTDTLPRSTREIAADLLGLEGTRLVGTYGQLARRLLDDLAISGQ